jgi:hypothetical protein
MGTPFERPPTGRDSDSLEAELGSRLASVAILLAALGTACGGSTPSGPPPPASVATVAVALASGSLAPGAMTQATAVLRDGSSNVLSGRTITWSSSSPGVATVSASGFVTAVGVGSADITATSEGKSGAATASVTASSIASVTVSVSTCVIPGQTAQASVELRDSSSRVLTGRAITWSSSATGVATVSASGLVTAITAGSTEITATSEGVSGSAAFRVPAAANTATQMAAVSALSQTGPPSSAAVQAPAVVVKGADGNPVQCANVLFTITAGGGTVTGSPATSDENGVARASTWTFGPAGAQAVRASTPAIAGVSVDFDGLSRPPSERFDITLRLLTPMSDSQARAFVDAKERIEEIITGDLPAQAVVASAAQCAAVNVNQVVDDVLILAEVAPIDGVGKILGQAGPCALRPTTSGSLPALGHMMFDTADLDSMEANGTLGKVILHEMLHVVGYGTLWGPPPGFGLLGDAGTDDPYFLGPFARNNMATYNNGAVYTGRPVPVENSGGPGTRDSHWREVVFRSELMTGYIGSGPGSVPLSATTVGSLQDLGYVVDVTKADPFDLANPTALRSSGLTVDEPPVHLEGDVRTEPPFRLGADGRPIAR